MRPQMSRLSRIQLKAVLAFGAAGWLAATPSGAVAQRSAVQQDSVMALLNALQQRLDSLERVIAELSANRQDTTEPIDELAALRAAAQAAAADAVQEDPAPPGEQQSRTRNLGILNPEISVTGDIVGSFTAPSGEANTFSGTPREFEFSFQSALDPYTRTKIFVTREEDFEIAGFPEEEGAEEERQGFEIEEGYMYWVGLPGGFGAKVGKFRQEIGLYNRWHTHALFEVERPLAAMIFLGEDGLIQTGAAVTLPTVTLGPATQTLTVEIARGDNEALFAGANELTYLGRFQNFWDLGVSTYLQFGATGMFGDNDEVLVESRLLVLDFSFRYAPSNQALYREFQLKGEWYLAEQDVGIDKFDGNGGYLQANYRLNRRWIAGARADYVDGYDDGPNIIQLVPSISWWQSEWVRLRLQYNYLKPDGLSGNHTLLLQFVWAMGPDKHETY